MALDLPCPYCGMQMYAEQAHNRCPQCLYIEPCCDGAPQQVCRPPAATAGPSAATAGPSAATAGPSAAVGG